MSKFQEALRQIQNKAKGKSAPKQSTGVQAKEHYWSWLDEQTKSSRTAKKSGAMNLIFQEGRNLTEEEMYDSCVFMDSCGGYYNYENDAFYTEEGQYVGNFSDVWGDDPIAIEPETFGVDEGEYKDFSDLAFWAARKSKYYDPKSDLDMQSNENLLKAVLKFFVDMENISESYLKLSLKVDVKDRDDKDLKKYVLVDGVWVDKDVGIYHTHNEVDVLTLSGYHPIIGPVWSSKVETVRFPSDYVEISNALLNISYHCELIQNLTYGCPHCWNRTLVNRADEIAEEIGCEEKLVDDILDACDEGELDFHGAIQPDCRVCLGAGILAFGGPAKIAN